MTTEKRIRRVGGMHFKLLVGQHIQGDLEAEPGKDGKYPERVYHAGEIFESESDLTRLNGPGMTPKFERVDDPRFQDENQRRRFLRSTPPESQQEGDDKEKGRKPTNWPTTVKPPAQPEYATEEGQQGLQENVGGVEDPTPAPAASVSSRPQQPQPQQPPQQQRPQQGHPPQPTPKSQQPQAQPQPKGEPKGEPKRDLEKEYGPLDKMTVQDLKELAEEEEIDLKGASRKEEMIKAIKAHQG
jgi:hypothetical protein